MVEPGLSVVREAKIAPAVVIRGAVGLLFGLLAVADPWMPVDRLAALFGVYAIIDGALSLYGAYRSRRIAKGRYPLAIEAIVSVAAGVVAIALPVAASLRFLGGLRALVVGASDVAWSRRDESADLAELGGIVAILFAIIILAWPGRGHEAYAWLLGLSAMVSGGLLLGGGAKQFTTPAVTAA